MAARTGMTEIITTLRGMTDAGNDDYTIGTITFWTDVALQGILDRHRVDYYEYAVSPKGSMTGGTIAITAMNLAFPTRKARQYSRSQT